jgi:predicted nucleic acid-binding protein
VIIPKFAIDTSVVVKWLLKENEAEVGPSLELLRLLKNGEIALFAPHFLLVELTNILFCKRKVTDKDIRAFVQKVAESGINFIGGPRTEEILDLVLKEKITAYDAIFLGLAKEREIKLISADKKLLEIKDWVITSSCALGMLK